MRVDHGTDRVERAIERQMRRGVGGGLPGPVDLIALEVKHHEILGGDRVIRDAARLDRDEPLLAVDAADVAPRQGDEPVGREGEIRVQDLLSKRLEHPP
jgi:hypothetical protein